jgi:hypothetical protein
MVFERPKSRSLAEPAENAERKKKRVRQKKFEVLSEPSASLVSAASGREAEVEKHTSISRRARRAAEEGTDLKGLKRRVLRFSLSPLRL